MSRHNAERLEQAVVASDTIHKGSGNSRSSRINGTKLTLAAKAEFGAWGQGVAWSKDGKTLLAQSMADKSIDVFSVRRQGAQKDRQHQSMAARRFFAPPFD